MESTAPAPTPAPRPLSNRERMGIPHQEMPLNNAEIRVTNFDEVPMGYSDDQAHQEAMRCLQCKKPACIGACPVGINIPAFIKLIEQGDIGGAAKKIRETNFLPAVCGRVCPQDKQCQAVCVVGRKNIPVGIGNLERYAADYERNLREIVAKLKRTGATLIWCSTTPIPQGKLNPPRQPGDEVTYNQIAQKVMTENGVVINDLHAVALSQQPGIQLPANVHFTKEGSAVLAKHVAASIKAVLPDRRR